MNTRIATLCLVGLWLAACGGDSVSRGEDGGSDSGALDGGLDGGPADGTGGRLDASQKPAEPAADGAMAPEPPDFGDAGMTDSSPPIIIDDAGNRVFVPGKMPLADYIPCVESSDCFAGNGSCIKEVTLNRAEPTASGSRNTVPVSELPGFESVESGHGVCSVSCTESVSACPNRFTLGARVDATPWVCQVVYVGESPYQRPAGLPLSPLPDPQQMTAGIPFGALCRPPFERTPNFAPDLCVPCSAARGENCGVGSACFSDAPHASAGTERLRGHCAPACSSTGDCPTGFACRVAGDDDVSISGASDGKFCFPVAGSCGHCVDRDADDRGEGACADGVASSVDCDDRVELTYYDADHMDHAFPLSCGPNADGNCNGLADDGEQVGVLGDDGELTYGAFHCSACFNACRGEFGQGDALASARCFPGALPNGAGDSCGPDCDTTVRADCNGDLDDGCELTVDNRDYLYVADCDGDGYGGAGLAPHFDCGGDLSGQCQSDCGTPSDDTTCMMVKALPTGAFGEDCNDDPAYGGDLAYPGAAERCDPSDATVDNDCDGTPDATELAIGGACSSNAVGACGAFAAFTCQPDGSRACTPAAPATEVCNGVDDDCNGAVDDGALEGLDANGAPALVGQGCAVAGGTGACGGGTTVCQAGVVVCDANQVQPTDRPGDGVDSNCDGFDGDLGRAVFIASNGSNAPDGTRGRPFKRFALALSFIAQRALSGQPVTQIYVATGSYDVPEALSITAADEGFSIVGGYSFTPPASGVSGGTWSDQPTTARSTLVFRQDASVPSSLCGAALTATECEAFSDPRGFKTAIDVSDPLDVLLKGINIQVNTPPEGFGTVVGLACESPGAGAAAGRTCRNLRLDNVAIDMRGGAPGRPGTATDGLPGGVPDSQLGASTTFTQYDSTNSYPVAHWVASCAADTTSGQCATYDTIDSTYSASYVYIDQTPTQAVFGYFDQSLSMYQHAVGIRPGGLDSSTCTEAKGGTGGGFVSSGGQTALSQPLAGTLPPGVTSGGEPGSFVFTASPTLTPSGAELDSLLGKPGASAVVGGTAGVAGESSLPLVLGTGTPGAQGSFGGGGGGSGARMLLARPSSYIQPGAGGAGGGCGGGAGSGGEPGGSIIGLYYNDPTEPNIASSAKLTITLGQAGAGGAGAKGGAGGQGGTPTVPTGPNASQHWQGGAGGGGAGGGGGGGGAGGWAVGVAYFENARQFDPDVIVSAGSGGGAGAPGKGGSGGDSGALTGSKGVDGADAESSPTGAGKATRFCLLNTTTLPNLASGKPVSCAQTCPAGSHPNATADGCDPDKEACAAVDDQGSALGSGYTFWDPSSSAYGPCYGPCLFGYVPAGQPCVDVDVVCPAGAQWTVDRCQ